MRYFAYGSNMNHDQMRYRCPSATFLGRAMLHDYRLVFDGFSIRWFGGVANVIPSTGSHVWGGLYEINSECVAALDKYEGHPIAYTRQLVSVTTSSGVSYNTICYMRSSLKPRKPGVRYFNVVRQGALDCGLPKWYVSNVVRVCE